MELYWRYWESYVDGQSPDIIVQMMMKVLSYQSSGRRKIYEYNDFLTFWSDRSKREIWCLEINRGITYTSSIRLVTSMIVLILENYDSCDCCPLLSIALFIGDGEMLLQSRLFLSFVLIRTLTPEHVIVSAILFAFSFSVRRYAFRWIHVVSLEVVQDSYVTTVKLIVEYDSRI